MTKQKLQEEISRLKEQLAETSARLAVARGQAEESRKLVEETRSNFADMKERLHNAEVENARLNGYMTRVHEGDIARDGHAEIKEGDEVRSVPKWPSPVIVRHNGHDEEMARHVYGDAMRRSRKHWTAY